MIVYKDVLGKLKNAGYSTWVLRKNALISERVLTKIRRNEPITFDKLNDICQLLDCQVGDILAYVPDSTDENAPIA